MIEGFMNEAPSETTTRAKVIETFEAIQRYLTSLPRLRLSELLRGSGRKIGLIVVDMVDGFCRHGDLASPRVEALVPKVTALVSAFKDKGLPVIALADTHSPESPEFAVFRPHCVSGSIESDIVEELGPTAAPR